MIWKDQIGKDVSVVAMVVIFMGTLAIFFLSQDKYQKVTSFEDCVKRGFDVMESHPRQCRANGVTFVEELQKENDPVDDVSASSTGGMSASDGVANAAPIAVESPLPGALVTSPLVVKGEAVGNWYFEASFPVRLLDGNGEELAVKPAQAQGEWMTTKYVPFTATLDFEKPATDTGILILEKDNPSGLPEHDGSLKIPIRFK